MGRCSRIAVSCCTKVRLPVAFDGDLQAGAIRRPKDWHRCRRFDILPAPVKPGYEVKGQNKARLFNDMRVEEYGFDPTGAACPSAACEFHAGPNVQIIAHIESQAENALPAALIRGVLRNGW